jgi:hypothetical protein
LTKQQTSVPLIVSTIQVIDLLNKIKIRKEQLHEELMASQTYITSSIANVNDTDVDE